MCEGCFQAEGLDAYGQRVRRVEDALVLREPDRVPIVPRISSVAQGMYGSSQRDVYYSHRRAGNATLRFYERYMPDAHTFAGFVSGRANELAGSTMMDWPGRPGSRLPDAAPHRALEFEYMAAGEYPQLLNDYTGFMLRKYLPRVFPGLGGLSDIRLLPGEFLNTGMLVYACSPQAQEAYATLGEIGRFDEEAAGLTAEYQDGLAEMGLPPLVSATGQAPYDILASCFRGRAGALADAATNEEQVAAACELFANRQLEALVAACEHLAVRRAAFHLHRGARGLAPRQYEHLYWRPLHRLLTLLIEKDITPVLHMEGRSNDRLAHLADFPRGKIILHLENADLAQAKKALGHMACLSGNLPAYLLEFGTREQVVDQCKRLLDSCAPGGGYIFSTDAGVENALPENLDAMFETVLAHGVY